jgi:hypothetical protein
MQVSLYILWWLIDTCFRVDLLYVLSFHNKLLDQFLVLRLVQALDYFL